ncbi:MAG: porin, partial [Elusimicrobiota bacterium]
LICGSVESIHSESVEAGFGKIKLTGLMQIWYQNNNGATPFDTFRLRRAEVKLSGEIKPDVSWAVMFDPAQQREDLARFSPLQDFLITMKPKKCYSVDFGQYKVPFGMEGLESSAKLDFVERSVLASQFKWADARDIGLTVKGDFNVGSTKIQPAIGLFNGEGQNKLDANQPMAIDGRIAVKPIKQLHIGVAHYNGKSGVAKTDNIHTGVEVKYSQDPITVYGEFASGKSSSKDKQTYYTAVGYKFLKLYQAVLRYDFYDTDTDTKDNAKTETTVGLNYFIENHNSKVQLNYVLRGEEGTSVSDDIVRVNVQISY